MIFPDLPIPSTSFFSHQSRLNHHSPCSSRSGRQPAYPLILPTLIQTKTPLSRLPR